MMKSAIPTVTMRTGDMMNKLKRCPFCGGEEIRIATRFILVKGDLADTIDVSVGCVSCGMGATAETEPEAIEAWNRRTP